MERGGVVADKIPGQPKGWQPAVWIEELWRTRGCPEPDDPPWGTGRYSPSEDAQRHLILYWKVMNRYHRELLWWNSHHSGKRARNIGNDAAIYLGRNLVNLANEMGDWNLLKITMNEPLQPKTKDWKEWVEEVRTEANDFLDSWLGNMHGSVDKISKKTRSLQSIWYHWNRFARV